MTNTETFTIAFPVMFYYEVKVERPSDSNPDEIVESITREELMSGYGESTWDDVKDAFNFGDADDWRILNSEGEDIS